MEQTFHKRTTKDSSGSIAVCCAAAKTKPPREAASLPQIGQERKLANSRATSEPGQPPTFDEKSIHRLGTE